MKKAVIYIHGQGGNAEESKHYENLFKNYDVIGFDYKSDTPWQAKVEFTEYFDGVFAKYDGVYVIANSIGAYFTMSTLADRKIEKAFFISPIVDMEKLIFDMMSLANVTEERLKDEKFITTDFGQTLSWDYLCYARNNPIKWQIPTHVLFGDKDNFTTLTTITDFVKKSGATLTVMENGEHWFHTERQMEFLDKWIELYK